MKLNLKPMTTTSEKILSEMERMGRMKIKDLCAQIGWQYQKFRRRIKANDFSPEIGRASCRERV